MAAELLRSTLSILRSLDRSLPGDNQALEVVVPPRLGKHVPLLQRALSDEPSNDHAADILQATVEVMVALVHDLVKRTPVIMLLQFYTGTSLFRTTFQSDLDTFSMVVRDFTNLAKEKIQTGKGGAASPLVLLIVSRELSQDSEAVQIAMKHGTFLSLSGLTEENIVEYTSNYLNVPEQIVPATLRQFVAKVTSGNPLYIRETIDQLQENQNLVLTMGVNGQARHLECKDIDQINISDWQRTSMVGSTLCLLESLEPLEAAVLKMSTCFQGPFTLPDLAASRCSQWTDTTHFDFLRLFNSIQTLVARGIIEKVDMPEPSMESENDQFGSTELRTIVNPIQHFQMRNMLLRSVGGSMVLEAQRKAVKRQALVGRALMRELPGRLEVLASMKNTQHIPWYYEQALRRM